MKKETLSSLLEGKLFCIPDYQRGYAWEKKQWDEFIQDVDAVIDEDVRNHYTGTVVIFKSRENPIENYGGTDKLEVVDIVDGQQRLTTCALYLSIVINELIKKGKEDFKQKIPIYLYADSKCKLKLNNDSNDFYFDLISKGVTNTHPNTTHQKRLYDAFNHLKTHINKQLEERKENALGYLVDIFDALVRKLIFTFYTIEEECEIGMTFELMNSRGKGLSILELLKNYFMYWISRNGKDEGERESLTKIINKSWKEVYTNIANCKGNEDQCLRVAWILYCTHIPKNWNQYDGFKENWVIPLRDFSIKTKEETNAFLKKFTDGLAEVSKHYAIATNPNPKTATIEETKWLLKILHAGNVANFLPIIIAARINFSKSIITETQYIEILKSLECYAYRVFLLERKRSNAGISSLYRWGSEILGNKQPIQNYPNWINGLVNRYSEENEFIEKINKPLSWYYSKSLLKYTLFEYELWLLSEEGKGKTPKLKWDDLSDSTIEHILPQTIEKGSHWSAVWEQKEIELFLHDIANLVLTENNSNYKNYEFERKKGKQGEGYCYANSDIRQERKLSTFNDWTVKECNKRREEIVNWIQSRWSIVVDSSNLPENIDDEGNDE